MKNMADLESRLALELKASFRHRCELPGIDFFLWYLPTTANHDGGLLIAAEQPANSEYQLADDKPLQGSNQQIANYLRNAVLPRLPVLSLE